MMRPESKSRFGVGSRSSYLWETAASQFATPDALARFDTTPTGASATEDFRNEANTFGWIVEIDPYDPTSTPIKRTSMGWFRHEGCWPSRPIAGQPLAFYSGDDANNEYIYKFVTSANYQPGQTNGAILDEGTLYVARFDEDGTGEWLELSMANPTIANNPRFQGSNLADILVHTRVASDIVGATPMDRPEWGAVNPANGEVYMTLTNNTSSARRAGVNAANPRNYDADGNGSVDGNRNGHIIRWRETGDRADATAFTWDIFLFGSRAGKRPENISGLTEDNAFASPDGLWFDGRVNRGVIWIQTDDSSLGDFTNNQLLAAIVGDVGDGGEMRVDGQRTQVGKQLGADLRRFLTGPAGCEITGIDVTPDGRAMFVNVQHPGGEGDEPLVNNWPAASRDALAEPPPVAMGALARPRPATICITRIDGGIIGA